MNIGQSVVVRNRGEIQAGRVAKIFPESLEIILDNGEEIQRKFWEVKKVANTDEN